MVRRFLWALFFVGSVLGAQSALAQSDSLQTGRLNLKISPQHLFVNCLNLEIEKRIGSRQGLVFSPRLYSGQTRTVDYLSGRETQGKASVVFGYGAEVQHKFYQSKKLVPGSLTYVAYGLNFHHFELEFERQGWLEEMQNDGLSYYSYQYATFHEKINRIGGMVLLGTQKPFFRNRLFTDIYSGIGYRKSNSDTNLQESQFGANILDFGSTGLYLSAGLKVGFWL
jgi:hypothetical protein